MNVLSISGELWIALRIKGRKGKARREEIINSWLNTVHWTWYTSVLWGQNMLLTTGSSAMGFFSSCIPGFVKILKSEPIFISEPRGAWHYYYFQRPGDSQRWTNTNKNTISQSWGLAVEIKLGRGEHSFPVLMALIWDTIPSTMLLEKTIKLSK